MSSPSNSSDQELRGLLLELCGQNDRHLLTSAFSALRTQIAKSIEPISSRMPGLSSLERHLVDVHREALAELLKEACLDLLLNCPSLASRVVPNRNEMEEECLPRPAGRLSKDAAVLIESNVWASREADTRALVQRLLIQPRSSTPSLRVVAEAGSSLAPSEALSIYRARGLEAEGEHSAACELLIDTYRTPANAMNRLVAAGTVAAIVDRDGDLASAVKWYERSAGTSERYWVAAAPWITCCIKAGDSRSLARAKAVFLERECANSLRTQTYLKATRASRFSGSWSPSSLARTFVAENICHETELHAFFSLFE